MYCSNFIEINSIK